MSLKRYLQQQERAARARQKELQRRHKETAKLTALEQAKLEFEEFENQLDLLISLHKEPSPTINWQTFGSLLPPCPPMRIPRRELLHLFDHARRWTSATRNDGLADAAAGRNEDDQIHAATLSEHESQVGEWKRIRALAQRVHAGEPNAYSEALAEFSNLSEISNLGSSIQITVHSPHLAASSIASLLLIKDQLAVTVPVPSLPLLPQFDPRNKPSYRAFSILSLCKW